MAFLNFLKPGTYSYVGNIFFLKKEKRLAFELNVYDDAEKKKFLFKRSFSLSCARKIRTIYGLDITDLPEVLPTNEQTDRAYYHISKNLNDLQGELVHYPNLLACWDTVKKSWSYWYIAEGEIFYSEVDNKYLCYESGAFIETTCFDDRRHWDRFFDPDVSMNPDEASLHSAIYSYLKTLPEFQGCQDG